MSGACDVDGVRVDLTLDTANQLERSILSGPAWTWEFVASHDFSQDVETRVQTLHAGEGSL